MIIFDDIAGRRFISRLDPRVRIACVLVFSVLICLCERPAVIASGFVASLILLAMSGITFQRALKRCMTLNVFMLLLVVTMPLFMPGTPLFQMAGLTWTAEGLARAVLVAVRANVVMIMLTALLGSMESSHLGFALSGLGVPKKFAHLLLFMVRYIEVIHHEYHHLRDAMLLRAFRPRFNRHTFRTFGFMIGQLLVRSINRSERILEAMKCRGFRGRFYVLAPCRIEGADIVFALLVFAGMCALTVWEWM